MAKYDYYEDLEEQAYQDSITPKKKPKKQKKNWSEELSKKKVDYSKKDNKYNSNPKRI